MSVNETLRMQKDLVRERRVERRRMRRFIAGEGGKGLDGRVERGNSIRLKGLLGSGLWGANLFLF